MYRLSPLRNFTICIIVKKKQDYQLIKHIRAKTTNSSQNQRNLLLKRNKSTLNRHKNRNSNYLPLKTYLKSLLKVGAY